MTAPIRTDSNFLVDIKTSIVKGLRAAFGDLDYPDSIKQLKISMEYPMAEDSYPHLWVQFSLTKLQNAGIGHISWEDNTLRHEFIYNGTVRLNIVALSSLSRDVYASQLVQMLAFRELNPVAAKFDDYLKNESKIHLTINKDTIGLQGQSVNAGTPWSDTEYVYEDGYTFDVIGQISSTFTTTPEILKKISITATDSLDGTTNTYEIAEGKPVPGQWV